MAPMIDLQNGVLHIHSLHTRLQFTVEGDPCGVKTLVIGSDRQHKMPEYSLRNIPPHLLSCLE